MKEIGLQLSLLKKIILTNDISVDEELFTGVRKELYSILKKYYSEKGQFPTEETIQHYVKKNNLDKEISASYYEIELADDINKEYAIDELTDNLIFRKLKEHEDSFLRESEKQGVRVAYPKFISNLLQVNGNKTNLQKGFVWETAKERWERYKTLEDGEKIKIPKFRIDCLDKNIIMAPGEPAVIVFIASPGVGKTTVCMNIGYNLARFENERVMFISGEMSKNELSVIFDARDSMIDSMLIRRGNLSDSLRDKYKETLKEQYRRKDKFYIIDTTETGSSFTAEDIISWMNQYKLEFGEYPTKICADYLWLMETNRKYQGNAEKLGYCTLDLVQKIAKPFKIQVITSSQESRDGQKLKQQKKIRGLESIGESNKIGAHANVVIMLDQFRDSDDIELKNKIQMHCVKNRFGPLFTEKAWYLREYSYIGDSHMGLISVPDKKETEKPKKKKENKEEDSDFKFEDL